MTACTVSPKFQVVISRGVREALDLKPGTKFQVLHIDDRIELIPTRPMKVPSVADESRALRAVAHMRQGRVVAIDEGLALSAAKLSLKHRLPMADSLILAATRAHDAVLWTGDAHFAGLPGVRYVAR